MPSNLSTVAAGMVAIRNNNMCSPDMDSLSMEDIHHRAMAPDQVTAHPLAHTGMAAGMGVISSSHSGGPEVVLEQVAVLL